VNLYEKHFFEQIVNVKDKLQTRTQTDTSADNRLHANLVPNYKKIAPGDTPEISSLKKQRSGNVNISPETAQKIIADYKLSFEPGKTQPKQLSTSGIYLGYNPASRTFFLKK
jgi:hypothetical protein